MSERERIAKELQYGSGKIWIDNPDDIGWIIDNGKLADYILAELRKARRETAKRIRSEFIGKLYGEKAIRICEKVMAEN